ncbi:hypothetical protein BH708_01705 [Brachybacterium sp. P6-10-X1]|uniref:septation protein SepH n=1 Tax=Brachybacterium sp. P6-10-X1 TaxID=1903186 RepID=UPI000971A664|nr:septation protein SepH [Brachybacterium sp. P6-10-X1]APX31641.1 hypothetical protein BH708_01705 [Brachybacterium sp. P6-10-X1]
MRELELDGIHDDGEHVILVDSDGERYTLRIDKALRAAVRTDRPALGMIQAADAAPLRPREIQAMLRSGRSAEDISEAAEIPLDHVRRYEGPVLAEREFTAQRARSFPVGRGGPSLDHVVAERLAAREATDETAWDAWRRTDGSWTLELTFSAGGRTRQAHWVADLDNRSVAPVDDEARWISDEDAPPEPARGRGRLQAVKSSVYDVEADGAFDERPAGPRRRTPWSDHHPISEDHPSTLDEGELDALNARRGLRSVPPPEDDSATVWSSLDEDPAEEGAGSVARGDAAPAAADAGASAPSAQEVDGELEDSDREAQLEHADAPESASAEDDADPAADAAAQEADAPSGEDEEAGPAADEIRYQDTVDLTPLPGFDEPAGASPSPRGEDEKATKSSSSPTPGRSKSRSKRASMPSWDEIVFGSKHD